MTTGICPFCGKRVDKFIMYRADIVGCRYCGIHTKQTNADRIRSMSDEELSEMFCLMSGGVHPFSISDSSDGEQWIKWLKEEVKDG